MTQASLAAAFFMLVLILSGHLSLARGQSINAYVSADSVRIGDRFYLTLVATHESNQAPVFPSAQDGPEIFGDLEVVTIYDGGSEEVEGSTTGARIDSLVYEVTTFALDTAYVPSIPVFFVANGDTSFYASRPLELPVVSLMTADADNIRDIKPIMEFPRNIWPWIIGLLLLAAVVSGLIYYLGRRPEVVEEVFVRAPAPVLAPYEEALNKLRTLEKSARLDDLHQIKPFYVDLTEILRVYLGRRLEINAMESTSKELMDDLNRLALSTNVPDQAAYLVRRILHVSDLVKFADMRPRPEVGTQALLETRKAIDAIEESFKPAEIAEPPVEELYDETRVEHAHDN